MPSPQSCEMMETQRDRKVLAAVCPNQMGRRRRRAAPKVLGPRSSSPVRLGLPCVLKQAFSTIAWDDLEDSVRRESHSLGAQVNGCDEDQHFGDYALDFIADSPSTLESSLSPAELLPFHGCVIPPLTPQWDISTEDSSLSGPHTDQETCGPPSRGVALEAPTGADHCVHFVLGDTGQRQREGTDVLQERNVHLRQLARRAKHLASVLEELMTVTAREPPPPPPPPPPHDRASLSPCKRQRLDEGYETESSDSVEDMLRDISTRCNAVLHISASARQQGSGVIRVHGAFSGLQTSFCSESSGTEADGNICSFRTSVREHGTIRTQAFPHGHTFTARTQEGGYRFRWVPNHS